MLASALVVALFSSAAVLAQSTYRIVPANLSSTERAELEAIMAEHIQLTLKGMKPQEGQLFPPKVTAKFDGDGMLLIELGRRFIVKPDGTLVSDVQLADQLHGFTAVIGTVAPEVKYKGIEYLFDGKNADNYYPDVFSSIHTNAAPEAYPPFPPYVPPPVYDDPGRMYVPPQHYPIGTYNPPSVAINPGHGLYKLYNAGTLNPNYRWAKQRPESNGIVEDDITPIYATELERWFSERSPGIDTFSTRSTSNEVHTQSTQESGITYRWSDMGAKYNVEQIYPGRTDLWDVTGGTDSDRDYSKDINSRALFANEMGAQAMISLHTNAAPTPETALTARGTQVFYDSTRNAESQALATSIACYVREIVTAQPGYQNWTMRDTEHSTRYGENKGSMPSALIEIAFHTHPDDARALQDTAFRTASMKGVEKGYRMWREGKPCQALAISSVSDATGTNDGSKNAVAQVQFAGYPTFPVKLKIEYIQCQSGWKCTGSEKTIATAQASPLSWTASCSGSASTATATHRVRTTLTDADGVKSSPVESNVTCSKASGSTTQTASTVSIQ